MEFEPVHSAMSPEALECPCEVSLGWDSDRATSRDDAEQDRGSVCSLSAASEEHVESGLGDVLKLSLRWRLSIGTSGSSMKRKSALP